MEMMEGFAALILTPVIFVIYHRIVHTVYYGSMSRAIFKELFGCFLVSVMIVSIMHVVGGGILSFMGSALGFILKLALIIIVVSIVLYLVYGLIQKKKTGVFPFPNLSGDDEDNSAKPEDKTAEESAAVDTSASPVNAEATGSDAPESPASSEPVISDSAEQTP